MLLHILLGFSARTHAPPMIFRHSACVHMLLHLLLGFSACTHAPLSASALPMTFRRSACVHMPPGIPVCCSLRRCSEPIPAIQDKSKNLPGHPLHRVDTHLRLHYAP